MSLSGKDVEPREHGSACGHIGEGSSSSATEGSKRKQYEQSKANRIARFASAWCTVWQYPIRDYAYHSTV